MDHRSSFSAFAPPRGRRFRAFVGGLTAALAFGCASHPKPRFAIIPCSGIRTLSVRNGSKGPLEIYAVNLDGTQKTMLDVVQPGLTPLVLPQGAGAAFIAQYTSPLKRSGGGRVIATSTQIGNDAEVYSSLVTFSMRCT